MKIRTTLLIGIGLPVLLQLGTLVALTWSSANVDHIVAQEAKAKKVSVLCIQINGLLDQILLGLCGAGLIGSERMMGPQDMVGLLKNDFKELAEVVKDNPEAAPLVSRYQTESYSLIEHISDMAKSYKFGSEDFVFSQFLGQDEFVESLTSVYRQVQNDGLKITQMYAPIAREAQPQAIKAREHLRMGIMAGIILNVAVVILLGVAVSRQAITRLKILMDNMQQFSMGQRALQRLSGNDELADLDRAFAEMSAARYKLEDIKKSMRSMVSHDLRSPLTTVSMRIELLLDNEDSVPQKLQRELQIIGGEIRRLWRLSNTLLDIDKIEDGKIEVLLRSQPCKDLVKTAIEAIEMQAQARGISCKSEVPEDIACLCDYDRSIQILVNLASNAVKFSPNKSTISINAYQREEMMRFEIIDQGPGVPEEKQHLLFSKFTQFDQAAETKKQGSGLGLYISKMLVAAQNGQIGYYRQQEKGSCFWVELPISTDSRTAIAT